ncbi:response regulator [Neobacillus sp. MER 74]|uniref:response regulator transcription factor n=1 Tax=Bacillaceae TaxID=186817 RepID=UPI0015D4F91B|nr:MULTISPECIES: response regulator [Bacillaceae]MCM3113836.1 response regulator [Neobacillus sp. MER 74]
MYNVMVVDDEPVIRYGLKASVDWTREGLHYVGDYPNGEEALKAVEGITLDLLITDIKMPVMDGLILMKEMLQLFPRLKVILVSSYTDFDYVREGLQLGAVDYVLKPTLEPEDFTKLIQKCVDMIKMDRMVEEKLALVNQTTFIRERKSLEQAIKKVILEDASSEELHQKVSWLKEPFLLSTMTLNHNDMLEEQYGFLYKTMILEDVQNYFYNNMDEGICFPVNENQMFFLLNTKVDPYVVIGKLKEELEQETNSSFTVGFEMIQDLLSVKKGFERSRLASEQRFFHSNESIFRYESFKAGKLTSLDIEWLHPILLPYDKQRLMDFLTNRFQEWESKMALPMEIKNDACEIFGHLFMKQLDFDTLMEKYEQIKKIETLDEIKSTLLLQIEEYVELGQQKRHHPHADNAIMQKALDFIHGHYTGELTLQLVSSHVHISRNYFSVLFKQLIGENFIDYVMNLRIQKAKELLENTSLKVYEVAEQSGFNDVKYFSKLFKKLIGSTPIDFRSKNQSPF